MYDTSNRDGIIHRISMAGYVSILKSISSIDESLWPPRREQEMSLVLPQHIRGHKALEFERRKSAPRKQRRLLSGQTASHYLQIVISAICVCVYVCVRLCVWVCACLYIYPYHIHTYICLLMFIYTHIWPNVYISNMHICTYPHAFTQTYRERYKLILKVVLERQSDKQKTRKFSIIRD